MDKSRSAFVAIFVLVCQNVYSGNSTEISYSTITGHDDHGNIVYTRGSEEAEHFYSYANTNSQNQFTDSEGAPVTLFSNQFYTNQMKSKIDPGGHVYYYEYDSRGRPVKTSNPDSTFKLIQYNDTSNHCLLPEPVSQTGE